MLGWVFQPATWVRLNSDYELLPNMRSRSVGELPGIVESVVLDAAVSGAGAALAGSGLTCSAVTNNRLIDVPIGVHVIKVKIGLVVG